MIAGVRGGWQTIIADLALILFMVAAAAMGTDEPESLDNPLPARGTPLAIYRAGEGAPPIGAWLAAQAADDRQHLTIVSRYPAGGMDAAAAVARALASEAGQLEIRPRIVLEPAEEAEAFAVLAFDAPGDWHVDCKDGRMTGASAAPGKDSSCD